jgi:hypothetical protein
MRPEWRHLPQRVPENVHTFLIAVCAGSESGADCKVHPRARFEGDSTPPETTLESRFAIAVGRHTREANTMARARLLRPSDIDLSEPYRGDRSEVTVAMLIFIMAVAALAAFIWFGADPAIRPTLLLTGVLGGVTGWGAGILLTPYRSEEGPGDLQKMLLAGLVGYVIAKLNMLSDVIAGLGSGASGVSNILPFAAVALTLFICAMALTYIHRTYKMSRPAREAVALSRLARVQRERRESQPRRPAQVARLPLESVPPRNVEEEEAELEVQRR